MPALVLFNQRTMFAGDDLRCLTKLHAIWRVMQFGLAVGMSGIHFYNLGKDEELLSEIEKCRESGEFTALTQNGRLLLHVYEFSTIFLCFLSLAILASMHSVSGLGTPTDPSLRRPLIPLCYFDMIGTNFLRLASLTIGALCIYVVDSYCECFTNDSSIEGLQDIRKRCPNLGPFISMLFVLFGTHIVDAVCAMLTLIYFTCRFAPQVKLVSSAQRCAILLRCCFGCSTILTCCLFGGRDAILGDFAEFSMIIANYLNNNGILDLTASDVLMGLDMVKRLRRQHTLTARERLIQESTESIHGDEKVLDTDQLESVVVTEKVITERIEPQQREILKEMDSSLVSPDNRQTKEDRLRQKEVLSSRDTREVYLMAEAARFSVYAQAAYTWVSYILEHPVTGFCSLSYQILRRCNWCFCSTMKDSIKGDHLWRPHSIALELISGLSSEEIVYASFYDTMDAIPYYIALDHEWKTVVLAIRGTLTLESVFADINVVPTGLTEMGEECGFDGNGLYCHKGMLESSKWVYQDLKSHGKLEAALSENEGYRLRVVGHSLGAAVASIVSVFIRPRYPNLRCIAFSPPGCTMSEKLADLTSTYTYSFIVDDDIIARMTIEGFEDLRDSVLEMICRVKIPKYQVGGLARNYDFKTLQGVTQSIEDTLWKTEDTKESRFKEQVEEFWQFQAELKKGKNYVKLCPPGSIIHLFRTKSNRQSRFIGNLASSIRSVDRFEYEQEPKVVRKYTARWAKRRDFEKIEICSHMLLDHDPIGVKMKIQTVAEEQFGLQDPFSWKDLDDSLPA